MEIKLPVKTREPRSLEILMFAMGSAGDIHPYAGIGKALRARGHRVVLMANAYFEPVIREAGLEFVSSGSAEEYLGLIQNAGLWESSGGYRLMFEKMLDAMVLTYRGIASRYVPGKTVVVAPSTAFGARLANEKLGAPLVSMNIETNIFRSVHEQPGREVPKAWKPLLPPLRRTIMAAMDRWFFDPHLLPKINAFRAELGLDPIRRVMLTWLHSPQCVIGLFPQWFAGRQPDWPPNLHLTGFPLFDGAEPGRMSPQLREFLDQGEPPLVFTPGSAMRLGRDFFQTSVEACRILGRRAILLTEFADQVPESLPAGVRHFPYVPFSALLPRAAALVHHGGIGTTAQGLRAGIPQLTTPMIFDQPHNAARLRRLGVGDSIQPRHYTPAAAAEKLAPLTTSAEVRARCRAVAARFEGTDPLSETCALIESAISQPQAAAASPTR